MTQDTGSPHRSSTTSRIRRPALASPGAFIRHFVSNAIRGYITVFFFVLFIDIFLFFLLFGFSIVGLIIGLFTPILGQLEEYFAEHFKIFMRSKFGFNAAALSLAVLYMLEDLGFPGPRRVLNRAWNKISDIF